MRISIITAVVLSMLVGVTTAQSAEHTLRVGTVAPQGTPWFKIVKRMKRRVEKGSNGRIKVKIFAGQSMGGEKSIVRRLKKGTLEMVGVSTGAMATIVPELNAYELPYLFKSFRQADKVLDATKGDAAALMAKKGIKLYIWSENGFRDFAAKDKFIRTPSDLKGMKMRAQESFVHTSMYKALGAKPNPIAVPNVPESLANGVVSGYDNTLLYSFAAQWHKRIKYLTVSNHIYQPAVIAYNKKWFNRLPLDLQTLLMADAEKETKKGRMRIRAMNARLQGMFEKDGVKFYKPNNGERSKMQAATKSVYNAFRKRAGASGSKLLDAILRAR